ncbi:MAG: MBL fold metallo-hydrolase [Xanthobacteraceae bacterium]|jgi:L-ascorbate metabolism protein UlaG (beta-lactamase superfamily)
MRFTRRRLITGLSAMAAAAGGLASVRAAHARYYEGALSDHFDGLRFVDPHGMAPKGIPDLLRWWTARGRITWSDWVPSPYADEPPARVDGRALRVSFIGHASLLVQTAGLNILIDPVWSDRVSPIDFVGPKRVNAPGIAFDALPKIDVVLISHNHYDHLDMATLSRLVATHRPRIITPLGNDTVMRAQDPAIAAEAYDWGDRVALGNGVEVTLAPMRHWSARGVLDRNKALWAAFIIATPAGRIYHVADSGYGDGFRFREASALYGPFRLAILPIGAYEPRWFMRDQHMNPEESVKAFADCGAELALAHHHGTFQLTDEAIEAPVEALAATLAHSGIAAERFRTLKPGQVWEL